MADKLLLIEEMQTTCDRYKMQVENAKAELDAKKKLFDQANTRLSSLIRLGEAALKDQQPLFKPEESNGKAKAKDKAKAPAADAAPVKPDAWKKHPVKDAITLGAVANALETWDVPVLTLGDLWLWLQKHKFEDLSGVGPDKAAKAADQMGEFFKAHPEYNQ